MFDLIQCFISFCTPPSSTPGANHNLATSLNFTLIPCALLQKPQYILKLLDPIRFQNRNRFPHSQDLISTFFTIKHHFQRLLQLISPLAFFTLSSQLLPTHRSYPTVPRLRPKMASCCRASSTMELRCTFPVGTCGRNMVTPKDSGNSSDSHIHGKVLLDSAKWLKTILRFNTNKNHIAQPVQKYSMTQVGTSGLQHQPWVLVHLETKVDLKAFHGSHDFLFQPAKTLQLLCLCV